MFQVVRRWKHFEQWRNMILWWLLHSFLPPNIGGVSRFWNLDKEGVMKILLRNRGVSWKGAFLRKRGFPNCFISFPLEKHVFITIGMLFSVINRSIFSCGLRFTRKWYEIYFPLTLNFKYNSVKILLLITFISISISLKTSNILENKSQVFERSDCTITVHNDLYYNELKI